MAEFETGNIRNGNILVISYAESRVLYKYAVNMPVGQSRRIVRIPLYNIPDYSVSIGIIGQGTSVFIIHTQRPGNISIRGQFCKMAFNTVNIIIESFGLKYILYVNARSSVIRNRLSARLGSDIAGESYGKQSVLSFLYPYGIQINTVPV